MTVANYGSDTNFLGAKFGTSYSAPLVAGYAAMVLADDPTWLPNQVAAEIFGDSTPDIVTGAGAGSPNRLLNTRPVADLPGCAGAPKILVVGDSISQGLEDDYTWRWRLAQHLSQSGCSQASFVGPYVGTTRIPASRPEGPTAPAVPIFTGSYRKGLVFNSRHKAQWGRQMHQEANPVTAGGEAPIQTTVSIYQPDYLLVELGFNDLGWGVSSPLGLGQDLDRLITAARVAKPNVRILVANVPHRAYLDVRPDLGSRISTYGASLPNQISGLSTAASPVRLVDIDSGYDPVSLARLRAGARSA